MNKPQIRIKGFEGEWGKLLFSFVAKLSRGLTYSPDNITTNGIRVLRSSNINEDTFIISENDVFVNPQCVNIPLASDGDILITAANGSPRLVGKHAIIKKDKNEKFVPGGFMLVASTDEPDFVNACMGGKWYKKFLRTGVSGGNGAIGNLNKQELENFDIYIPQDKKERIYISVFFRSLDSLIHSTAKKIASLKQIKAASLQSMFPQNGETKPKVRFKGFEGEWEKKQLSDIFTERHIISTITKDLPQLSFTIAEGVIRPEDRKSNKRDFLIKDKDNKKYLVTYVDDIIYNPANVVFGAIHRNGLCNGVVSPIYKIFHTNYDSRFMECVVRHPEFISEMTNYTEGTVTKLKTLKPESFLKMSAIVTSSFDEQQKIGNYFAALNSQIDNLSKKLEKLKQIKSTCLDKMFV